MKSVVFALSIVVVGATLAAAEDAGKATAPPSGKVICDKQYTVISPQGEQEMGTFGVRAVETGPDKKIHITETLSMDYRGKKASYRSTVIYRGGSPPVPQSATAETRLNGKVCMKGTIEFSEKTASIEGTGFLDVRTGETLRPPKTFGKKDEPKPEGVLIFQSALPTIGPRILPKPGELKDVVFIEFPDDVGAPELANFKKRYRLVREKPDENGEYDMKLYRPHSDESISHIRYDKNDQIVSFTAFGKVKFREVKEGTK